MSVSTAVRGASHSARSPSLGMEQASQTGNKYQLIGLSVGAKAFCGREGQAMIEQQCPFDAFSSQNPAPVSCTSFSHSSPHPAPSLANIWDARLIEILRQGRQCGLRVVAISSVRCMVHVWWFPGSPHDVAHRTGMTQKSWESTANRHLYGPIYLNVPLSLSLSLALPFTTGFKNLQEKSSTKRRLQSLT